MGTDADNNTQDGTEIVKLDFVDMAFEGKSCGDDDISPNGECFSFHPYFLVKYMEVELSI